MQSIYPLAGHGALRLSTARYYTPNGRSIQASGIVPDVVVESRQFKEPVAGYGRVKENDLPGHLENENKPVESKKNGDIDELLARDYQLNEAFNLLKGLVFFKQPEAEPKPLPAPQP